MIARLYAPADHEEWLRLRRALWPDLARDTEEEDAAAWLDRADAAVIVVPGLNASALVGFAEVGERAYADGCASSPLAYLEGWYVESAVRDMGVGAALVRAVEAWARERGYSELASDVQLPNLGAQRAHVAVGFIEVERAVLYRKTL